MKKARDIRAAARRVKWHADRLVAAYPDLAADLRLVANVALVWESERFPALEDDRRGRGRTERPQ